MGSKIRGRQIADSALNDGHIAADAAIATSKLADGDLIIMSDGATAFQADQSMGGHKLTNVGSASSANDAVNKADLDAAVAGLTSLWSSKAAARAASTANITISNPGTASFDGVTLTSGQVLFVRAQTSQAENGLYTFNGSGSALTRISTMDTWNEIPGALFTVTEGTAYADTMWLCTADTGGTLGTTAITFQQVNAAGLSLSNFVVEEVPSGSINGSNVTFSLANTPTGTVALYLNGLRLRSGSGNDFTISGSTITLATAPTTGETLFADYMK